MGLKVIDNRTRVMKKGHLWVFGDEEIVKPLIEEAGKIFSASFMYTSSAESNFKKGWCTKSKK